MTTRQVLQTVLDRLPDEELESLAALLRDAGLLPELAADRREPDAIDARDQPRLAAIWDNDDDAIYDDL